MAGKLSSVFNEGSLFKRTLLHVGTFLVGSVTFIAVMSFVLVSIAKGIAPSSGSPSTSTPTTAAAKTSASAAASAEAADDEPEASSAPAGVPPGMAGARGRFGAGRHPMRGKGRPNMAGRNGAAAD